MADAPDKISITICGDGGCEDSYSVTRTIDGLPYFLSITDTAGQEEYRGLWTASNLKSDAFLLVYDITNESSLSALDDFMELINIEAEQRVEDNQRLLKELGGDAQGLDVGMPPPIKIVAGNKCDLKEGRVIGAREGLEYARKHGCGFMETSAREMVNIEETFALLVRRVVEARRLHYQRGTSATNAPQPPGPSTEKPTDAAAAPEITNSHQPKAKNLRHSILGMFKKGEEPAHKSSKQEKPSDDLRPSIWRRLCCRG
ncbi:putative RAS small monomeric GTPase [Aspergillus affinis]|uniref:putative RAS small monomeric GTPase n=1 Tax=Aspergillus affinis TaxID=1070780 RepID=UPI0022FF33F7|nr:ras-domain-containing protein [Aspergillus affinis]KAI9040482.1 ras-domain-containing protein [Aspergillus affinis]